MTVVELIKKLQEYPENTEVKIFDWRKNLNSDSGDGGSSGIYDFKVDMEILDDEEKSFFHEFHGKDHVPFVELTFDNDDYTCGIDELEPIPLTEEILLKCGFKHESMYIIKNLYLIEYGDFYFVLDECNGYYHVKLSNSGFGHEKQVGLGMIKYIHQLQNLYFALTGKELEIKL